jgi:hypothetical protein
VRQQVRYKLPRQLLIEQNADVRLRFAHRLERRDDLFWRTDGNASGNSSTL